MTEMQWVMENWMLLVVGCGMLAMHLLGHGHKDRGLALQPDGAKRAEASRPETMDQAGGGTDG